MAIGSTIVVSQPAVGTTTHTLAKLFDGNYQVLLTPVSGYPDIPIKVFLRPSMSSDPSTKQFGMTLRFEPSQIEDEINPSLGKVTVSINCNAKLGTVVTEAEMKILLGEALSVMVQSGIVDACSEGSFE